MHLFDRLDVVDVVDGFHLCHPLVVLEPPDWPDHTQQKQHEQATETEAAAAAACQGKVLPVVCPRLHRRIRKTFASGAKNLCPHDR